MPKHGRAAPEPIRRVRDASVWGPNGIGADDARIRGLLRVAFPTLDICLGLFGVGGAVFGIPALRDVFDGTVYPTLWSVTITVVSAGCLLGVGFPERFWRVEQYGKSMLSWLLTVYVGALVYAGFVSGDLGRATVAFIPALIVPFLVWRVLDVAKDARRNGWKGAPRGR